MKASFAKFKEVVGKIKAHEYTKCVVKVDKEEFNGTWKTVELPVVGKISVWDSDVVDKMKNALMHSSLLICS